MKTTVQCKLINLNDGGKDMINGLMQAFCSATRYSYKRLLQGQKILDIEKRVQLKYSFNSRYSKDAVEQARQVVLSQRELLIIQRDNWHSKVKQAEEALIKAKSKKKIRGLKSKLEKRRRSLAEPEKIYTCHNGVIGIDTNPDGIALTEVAVDGNFKSSIWIGNGELTTTSTEKKTNINGWK